MWAVQVRMRDKGTRRRATKTCLVPLKTATSAVATNVKLGIITSSPGLAPATARAECKATVPELRATHILPSRSFHTNT
jgi:hypothetical protein